MTVCDECGEEATHIIGKNTLCRKDWEKVAL